MTVCFVACGVKKAARPMTASMLYIGSFFRANREYASRVADRWYILSAKHGVLHPDQVIRPYDCSIAAFTADEREQWAARVWRRMEPLIEGAERIILLAGKNYVAPLLPRLEGRRLDVEGNPFMVMRRLKALREEA